MHRFILVLLALSTSLYAQSQQYPAPSGGGGGGSGDITDVGDCSNGACFTASGTGTGLVFKNATSGSVTLQTVTGALGSVTISLPASTSTVLTTTTLFNDTNLTMKVSRDSSTQLTWGGGCSSTHPCNVRIGDTVYTFPNDATIITPTGAGTLYLYIASDGTRTVGHNITSIGTCTNCLATGGISSFPPNSVPFATWTVTANAFDAAGGVDFRDVGGRDIVLAGTGLSKSGNTLNLNTAVVPTFTSGTGAAPGTCTLGERYLKTNTNQAYDCTSTNTFTEVTGSGSGTVTSVAQSFTGGLISVSGSPITASGTLALTVAGTSGGVPYFSGPTTWASSTAPANGNLMLWGGAGTAPFGGSYLTAAGFGTGMGLTVDATSSGNAFLSVKATTGTTIAYLQFNGASTTQTDSIYWKANSASRMRLDYRLGNSTTTDQMVWVRNGETVDGPLRIMDTLGYIGIGQTAPTPTSTLGIGDMTASTGVTKVIIAAGAGQSTTNLVEFRAFNATFGSGAFASGFDASGNLIFGADPADSGVIRLSNNTSIAWENATPGTDLTLTVDGSNLLVFSGTWGAATATSFAFGADPADAGAIRCSNNTICVASESATPGTDLTLKVNASDIFEFSAGISVPSITTTGSTPFLEFPQGTASAASANSVRIIPPTGITAYRIILPGTVGATGVAKVSVSGTDATLSFAAPTWAELAAGTGTNLTLDVEGTGNAITTVEKIWIPAAQCQNATASLLWDTPTSNPAVAACVTGTNTQKGVADFADSANLSMQQHIMLPSDWTGTVDARFKWLTTATTGSVVWQIATICVADAETDDPAFNTASTVTDAAKGTTNQTNDATITGVTVTGCAAGELMHIKVFRDSAHASDDLAATARLIGVELTMRRAQ